MRDADAPGSLGVDLLVAGETDDRAAWEADRAGVVDDGFAVLEVGEVRPAFDRGGDASPFVNTSDLELLHKQRFSHLQTINLYLF